MASYQYFSYYFYCEIHLLRFIFCYCTLIYKKYFNKSCFICNHKQVCLSHNFRINLFVIWSRIIFSCRQVNIIPSKSFDCSDTSNIEKRSHTANIGTWSPIGGCLIVVRDISIFFEFPGFSDS